MLSVAATDFTDAEIGVVLLPLLDLELRDLELRWPSLQHLTASYSILQHLTASYSILSTQQMCWPLIGIAPWLLRHEEDMLRKEDFAIGMRPRK